MRKIVQLQFLTIIVMFVSACKFQIGSNSVSQTSNSTPTSTQTDVERVAASITPSQEQTQIPLPTIDQATPTPTATEMIPPTPSFTPVPTFTPAPTRPLITTGILGQALIVKPSGAYPLGGAAVTLYDEKTKDDYASSLTIMDGTFRFTQVPTGKYYLVFVWMFTKLGAWPCSSNKIPPVGNKVNWNYEANGLPIYVEIRNSGEKGVIVVVSTGSFGVSGQRKNLEVPIICNQLR